AAVGTVHVAGAAGNGEEAKGGKPAQHVLKFGTLDDKAAKGSGDRYAVADGADRVFVLPGDLVRRLLAPPLQLRDRDLVRFSNADRVTLERGQRKATFTRAD